MYELAGLKEHCEKLSSPYDLAITPMNSLQLWSPAQGKAIKIEGFQQSALIGLNGYGEHEGGRWDAGHVESWGW